MTNKRTHTRVLVLGATGMLGFAVFTLFASSPGYAAFGTVRTAEALRSFPSKLHQNLFAGIDVENSDRLVPLLATIRPNIVVNCIGLVKQLPAGGDYFSAITINSLFPHRLARLCDLAGAQLIHISTDCVFSGVRGMYKESDVPDAADLYGRSKYLGEVDYDHAVTLRTSMIGHELGAPHSLLEWFLAQTDSVRGFKRAVFSGLPTIEIARIIRDYVIPHPEIHGPYHVSAQPINKFDLLTLISKVYKKSIEIIPDEEVLVDRSLDSTNFGLATGYTAPEWPDLIKAIYTHRISQGKYV
jgi:dTDP-4-dehydrorhamnose reductase